MTASRRFPRLCLSAALAAIVVLATVPAGAATITIVNTDGPGEGFNDNTATSPVGGNPGLTLGEQRLIAFQAAADVWGAVLDSAVEIRVQAGFDPLSCNSTSAVLGAAGTIQVVSDFANVQFANTWYHIALANSIAGSDLITGAPGTNADDIQATFNSSIDNNNNCLNGTNWYLGLDNNPGGDIDLFIVLLHEFGHGLGFANFVNDATGGLLGPPFQVDIFTRFSLDNSTGLHWNDMTDAQRAASAINTGNLVWDGANVVAGAAGLLTAGTDGAGNVRLYAPNPVEPGSSVSHFDTAVSPNALMEPFINDGLGTDLDLTDEQMEDVGWNLLAAAVCGNGVQEGAEECDGADLGGASCGDVGCGAGSPTCTGACTLDFMGCSNCGACNFNGTCEAGEDCNNCPSDCISGVLSGASCGNGICEAGDGEDCVSCAQDCNGKQNGNPNGRFCCGDGGGQNPVTCSDNRCTTGGFQCTTVPAPGGTFCCGDATCEGNEDSNNCGIDCPACMVTENPEASCSDGQDNDCDGLTDGNDPDCQVGCVPTSSKEKGPRCSDGIDNDCDGLIDGADPDC